MGRYTGILGLLTMLGLAYVFSTNRAAIRVKTVAWGLSLQVLFAIFVLRIDYGRRMFQVAGDAATRQHLEFLNDPAARAATTCERALLNRLGGGCQVPIGAFAEVRSAGRGEGSRSGNREGRDFSRADTTPRTRSASAAGVRLHLESIVADPDGSKVLRDSRDGDDPEKLGNDAGAALLSRGGDAILAAVYSRGLAIPPQP